MAGKGYAGAKTNNAGNARDSRAFCEGLERRALGTAANFPVTDNPHEVGSDASDAWILGWTVADDAATSTIDPDDAPNCAVTTATISA